MLRPLLTLQQLYHAVPTADAAAPGLIVIYKQLQTLHCILSACVCTCMFVLQPLVVGRLFACRLRTLDCCRHTYSAAALLHVR